MPSPVKPVSRLIMIASFLASLGGCLLLKTTTSFVLQEVFQPITGEITQNLEQVAILGIGGMAFSMLLLVPFFVLFYIIIYRIWKLLSPLASVYPEQRDRLLDAGTASGLLLVPCFQFYWIFPTLLRLESYGKLMSKHLGIRYAGPSRFIIWVNIVLFLSWIPAGVLLFAYTAFVILKDPESDMYSLFCLYNIVFTAMLSISTVTVYLFLSASNRMIRECRKAVAADKT